MCHFIEPLGLLYGNASRQAVADGLSLPLTRKEVSFTRVKLYENGRDCGMVSIHHIPSQWHDNLKKITSPVPRDNLLPSKRAAIMGIVNVTPDSFSCKGAHLAPDRALRTANDMIKDGVDCLDIGGESTRPHAQEVPPKQEWERIAPVIKALRQENPKCVISVDTRHAFVMEKALQEGVSIINDVSALTYNHNALPIVANARCGVILMHMRGTPKTMQQHTDYRHVAFDVTHGLRQHIERAIEGGVDPSKIYVDPGFGFAKTTQQNCEILRHITLLSNLNCRVVCGLSRKRFLGEVTQTKQAHMRDVSTVVGSMVSMCLGNPVLRVHNVQAMRQALSLWNALYNRDEPMK